MNNFEKFKNMLQKYLEDNDINIDIVSDLHTVSLNKDGNNPENYVYNGQHNLDVLDMDIIAQNGYRIIKKVEDINNVVNTADGFLINRQNEWFLIEFKDSELKASNNSLKNGVLKKAYSNLYMLLDILYAMRNSENEYSQFLFDDPIKFSKDNIYYILVCNSDKNPNVYRQIKNHDLIGERYTPDFMKRLKDYIFKDAYIYTEQQLEHKFTKTFAY